MASCYYSQLLPSVLHQPNSREVSEVYIEMCTLCDAYVFATTIIPHSIVVKTELVQVMDQLLNEPRLCLVKPIKPAAMTFL